METQLGTRHWSLMLAAFAGLALAACSDTADPATEETESASVSPASASPSESEEGEAAAACIADDLDVSITLVGPAGDGRLESTVVVYNTGAEPCALEGAPSVEAIDAEGMPLGVPSAASSDGAELQTLSADGGSATATISALDASAADDAECEPAPASGWNIWLPGESDTDTPIVVEGDFTACSSDAPWLETTAFESGR